ncbi:unnamed protein product [Heterobilharzia americana]|nr:unnamed protein product [Heterobilharzia americana]
MSEFSRDKFPFDASNKNLLKTVSNKSRTSILCDHDQNQYLTPSSFLTSNSLPTSLPPSNSLSLPKHESSCYSNNATNQPETFTLPDCNATFEIHSEVQTDGGIQKQQLSELMIQKNISKLEDILAGISLSTFVEPTKTANNGVTGLTSPKKQRSLSNNDEIHTNRDKLHPIFAEMSWAHLLFKDTNNLYDEFKENPERILDDHLNRIWKKRETQMLFEDRVDLLTENKEYSKRNYKNHREYYFINNVTVEQHNDSGNTLRKRLMRNQVYQDLKTQESSCDSNNKQYGFDPVKELLNEPIDMSNQSQVYDCNSHYCQSYDQSSYQMYYCLHDNFYGNCKNFCLKEVYESSTRGLIKPNNEKHSAVCYNKILQETMQDDNKSDISACLMRKDDRSNRIHLIKRRHSYFNCSDISRISNYRNSLLGCHSTQSLISLSTIINDKDGHLLKNSVICIVCISENSLPYIIICEDEQWNLRNFKERIIYQLYSNQQRNENTVYSELEISKQRFYFKTESSEFNSNAVYHEVIDEEEVIPRWKGLIWAKIEKDYTY